MNRVEPGFIRVEADEVTYNLHIMVRFEIELGLTDGSLKVAGLPEVWNAKMEEYLGLRPPNYTLGVLQDVHWSGGGFGSFPGYTVGNVMSAQVLSAAHQDMPELSKTLGDGNYLPLKNRLTNNVYQHGRAYNVTELLTRICDEDLRVQPYLDYLNNKFSDLYRLN